MKRIVLTLLAAFVVVASANTVSARVAAPDMLVSGNNVERVLLGSKKYKAPKFKYKKYSKFKYKKPRVPKGPGGGMGGNGAVGMYVVGGVVCSAAGPIINAALGNPEPTSEEVLLHMAGCFFPPLAIYQFIQGISNP